MKALAPVPLHRRQLAYDHLGNVWTVTPPDAQRARSFQYDPLGRLTQAANPENGTITYAYDDSGNLIDRRDAALARMCVVSAASTGCDSTPGYDALNRPLRRNYTSAVATPSVVYSYDQDLSGGGTNYYKGRLSSVTADSTTVSYNRYDAAGRVKKHTQTTDSVEYPFLYDYNPAGLNTLITYPSGRQVATVYDAAGRASGVSSGTTNYVSGAGYAPHGALSQSLSGGQYETRTYNWRLQPVGLTLGATAGSTSGRVDAGLWW
ncbi:MAG: RHS repeat protein [Bryobacterales bacterium]|nr:RHS repeat protein [Bryobacterales bacterium]